MVKLCGSDIIAGAQTEWGAFGYANANGVTMAVVPNGRRYDVTPYAAGEPVTGASPPAPARLALSLKSVTFSSYKDILIDTNFSDTAYPVPHWAVSEDTRSVTSSPVLFVSGSTLAATPVFKRLPANSAVAATLIVKRGIGVTSQHLTS